MLLIMQFINGFSDLKVLIENFLTMNPKILQYIVLAVPIVKIYLIRLIHISLYTIAFAFH